MDTRSAAMRLYIHKTLYARALAFQEGRQEAILELLGAIRPDLSPEAARAVAEAVPHLLPELHRKWIGMYVDTLFETARPEQVALLCDGTLENDAVLALSYVMFLESERMETQIAADLAQVDSMGVDLAQVAAELAVKLSQVEKAIMEARQSKASRYRRDRQEAVSDKTH